MSQFTSVQVQRPRGNWFDLSHDLKFTTKMGQLTPILIQECIPGDVFKGRSENLIRFAPLVAPVMHSIAVYTHYFFVPNRLVWDNWEKFITANNGKNNVPAVPGMEVQVEKNDLSDYLGLPIGLVPGISPIPHAAYQLIYNEYYRDQNLQAEVPCSLSDGVNNSPVELNVLRTRAWQHDYFTSALPFAQKGEAVQIPLAGLNDVRVYRQDDTPGTTSWDSDPSGSTTLVADRNEQPGTQVGQLWADTSSMAADAATINDLRRAFRLQEWLEKMARGGSRYIEQIYVHFGVKSSDARLQRPEFLGGARAPVIISEVLQTSESAETPQATMAGHALSAGSGRKFNYRCEEHGYIIGIQSIMPTTAYQQGIPRHFSRASHLDYAWPSFAHIGEQEIFNQEIFYDEADGDVNNQVFGYIPRYSEYRYTPSRVAGEFRDTLAFWHLGRIFENRPHLNADFIKCNPRTDIFAVNADDNQNLWCHTFHDVKAFRLLPKYGTPTL